jgi:hypothetical protein
MAGADLIVAIHWDDIEILQVIDEGEHGNPYAVQSGLLRLLTQLSIRRTSTTSTPTQAQRVSATRSRRAHSSWR